MGTSTGYNAPTSPQWQAVKSEVSRESKRGRPTNEVSRRIIGDFVRAAGGPRQISRGQGSLGRGKSAQRVAASFAGFATAVAQRGWQEALAEIGLARLVGLSIAEILDGVLDVLGGAANTVDDVDARNALSQLRDELLGEAETAEEVEQILVQSADGEALLRVIIDFYGFYLYQQFCRVFYERLVARVGDAAAEAFLTGIRDFLRSALREIHADRNLSGIDWAGSEGHALTDELLERTLLVFGGE